MKSKTVELDETTIEVKKLPIIKYAELFKEIKNLPQLFNDLEGISNDAFFEKLPSIIVNSLPDVIGILSIATLMDKKDLEQLGLEEIVNLSIAVIEINLSGLMQNEQIKKAIARFQTPTKSLTPLSQ